MHLPFKARAMGCVIPIAAAMFGCATTTPSAEPTDTCGAEALQSYVGQSVSALSGVTLPEPARLIGPNTAVTRDYRVERLNIHFDDGSQIIRIECG